MYSLSYPEELSWLRLYAVTDRGEIALRGERDFAHFDEALFRQQGDHRPQRVPGLVGSALRFNGIDQYFEIPASTPGLDVGEDDFTIELWIRTKQSVNTPPSIVDKRGHQPIGYLIYIYQGRPGLQLVDGGMASGAGEH